jgi:hypothetical protein
MCFGEDYIHLAKDTVCWLGSVNIVIDLRFHEAHKFISPAELLLISQLLCRMQLAFLSTSLYFASALYCSVVARLLAARCMQLFGKATMYSSRCSQRRGCVRARCAHNGEKLLRTVAPTRA